MLEAYAHRYLVLGQRVHATRIQFVFLENTLTDDTDEGKAKKEAEDQRVFERINESLLELKRSCVDLDLPVSLAIINRAIGTPPKTLEAFQIIITAIDAEIQSKLFLFVPPHRAKYHEIVLQSTITTAFPLASKEIVAAGNCLAAGLYTACVFHSMRAAEIGLRVLGDTLGVSFPDKPLELAEWQQIIENAESKIRAMKDLKPRAHREEELNFYSQAASQFIYFKDGFRVRVAHARETYEEAPAIKVFNHTLEFFDTLATRLKEPKPSV